MTLDLAKSLLFAAWNDAEHAMKLLDIARIELARGDVPGALEWIEQAKKPASFLEMKIDDAAKGVAELTS